MQQQLTDTLTRIIADDRLHARWLNTLSMMENTGARKISRYEHPVQVDLTVLKHAAEEARHAYYLKKQLSKLEEVSCPDYSAAYLLAPLLSRQYLSRIDVFACRYLRRKGIAPEKVFDLAYLLVTYAIEVRADELYALYQDALSAAGSKVNVKSIIMEEAGHLEEMTRMLNEYSPDWPMLAGEVCTFEQRLYEEWLPAIALETGTAVTSH